MKEGLSYTQQLSLEKQLYPDSGIDIPDEGPAMMRVDHSPNSLGVPIEDTTLARVMRIALWASKRLERPQESKLAYAQDREYRNRKVIEAEKAHAEGMVSDEDLAHERQWASLGEANPTLYSRNTRTRVGMYNCFATVAYLTGHRTTNENWMGFQFFPDAMSKDCSTYDELDAIVRPLTRKGLAVVQIALPTNPESRPRRKLAVQHALIVGEEKTKDGTPGRLVCFEKYGIQSTDPFRIVLLSDVFKLYWRNAAGKTGEFGEPLFNSVWAADTFENVRNNIPEEELRSLGFFERVYRRLTASRKT